MRTRGRIGAAAVALAALAVACGGGSGKPAASPAPTTNPPPTTATPSPGPSQAVADAKRDGVVAALATVPFAARVGVVAEVVAPEGVWVISRPADAIARYADGSRLGPETGEYPKDTISVKEYGEALLLSPDRSRILRAYPLPSVPATYLRLTDDAVYGGRPGDTTLDEYALPDAMVFRIDRRTYAATVRVFAPGAESEVLQPCFVLPGNWSVTKARLTMTDFAADATGVRARQANGTWTRLDPVTLTILRG